MSVAQDAATIAALSDDPRLVRIARERLDELVAEEAAQTGDPRCR